MLYVSFFDTLSFNADRSILDVVATIFLRFSRGAVTLFLVRSRILSAFVRGKKARKCLEVILACFRSGGLHFDVL